MKWVSRFSFHRRLQFTFLILILLPFIVVTFWSYTSVRENVSDKIARSNEETLKVIGSQIEKTVDSISFVSVYFSEAYDPAVLESLRYLKNTGNFGNYGVYTHYNKLKTTANILSVQSLDADLQIMLVNRENRILIGNQEIPVFSELPERLLQESGRLNEQEKYRCNGSPTAAPRCTGLLLCGTLHYRPAEPEQAGNAVCGHSESLFPQPAGYGQSGEQALAGGPEGEKHRCHG